MTSADQVAVIENGRVPRMSLSSMCRDGNHKTCRELKMRCVCDCHARQAAAPAKATKARARNSAPPPEPAPLPRTAKRAPVIALVKADPPAVVKKSYYRPIAEQVRPLLEEILVAGDRDWFRVVLFFKAMSAPLAVRKLRQTYSKTEWEFEGRKLEEVGQSAIYVRWVGSQERGIL
jgi:hypothetical protein